MRTLSGPLITLLGLTVTQPGYLVLLGYSTPLYLSTLGDITWTPPGGSSHTWKGTDAKVPGLSQDGKGSSSASLVLGNTDGAIGVLVLTEGAADIEVSIWAVYAGATASGDPVQVFGGVMDGADIAADKVTFVLVPQGNQTLESPRFFISQVNGFNWLKPADSVIHWGTGTYTLPGHWTTSPTRTGWGF